VHAFTDQWALSEVQTNVDFEYATPTSFVYSGTGVIGKPTCTNANLAPVPCAVPEPARFALFGFGLIGVGLSWCRLTR
jgi:PEP-CTERM motif